MQSKIITELEQEFIFPFHPYEYQISAIEQGSEHNKLLLPLKVGRGKTAIATWLGLYHTLHHGVTKLVFIVPASLVVQWCRWLETIKFNDGDKLDILQYQGSPKQRNMFTFEHDCIVMSHQIFVKDYLVKIAPAMANASDITVVYDEAQDGLRKIGNKIYRFFRTFVANKKIILLSGTPVSNPMDTYALVKLMSPNIYKTKRQFEQIHVAEKDYFGNITEWKNLAHMKTALYAKAVILDEGSIADLPKLIVTQLPYELAKLHKLAYDKLISEKFLIDDSGDILDATETTKLFHIAQQFVTTPELLNIKKLQATLLNCVKTVWGEDDSKLIVFANYRKTNQALLDYFNNKLKIKAVGCWGAFSRKEQQHNKDAFINNIDVKVLVGNPQSLGVGTDGLQRVCYRILFAELPLTSLRFEQAIGRIHRDGQTENCVIRCLMAVNTIQEALYFSLLNKDDLLQQILKQKVGLRQVFSC